MKIRVLIGGTAYLELAFPQRNQDQHFGVFFTVSSLIYSAQSDKHGKNNKGLILFFPDEILLALVTFCWHV